MKLEKLKVEGFRCFSNPIEIDFSQLTLLIGNNGVGKSSILDILEIALSNAKTPSEKSDYFSCEDERHNANKIVVYIDFKVDQGEESNKFAINNIIRYKAIYTPENTEKYYLTNIPKEEDLRVDFSKLQAEPQKDIIQKYDPDSLQSCTNASLRIKWFEEFINLPSLEKIEDWKETPNELLKMFPRIQRYSSMDYKSPESLIDHTVKQVFESELYEDSGDESSFGKVLKKPLRQLEAEATEKINQKIAELNSYIRRYTPTITDISYEPQIDFSRGFQSGLIKINEGRGNHYLDKSGDGTKRKIFMATTDWDRAVTLSMQSESNNLPNVIRAYDEPDTNLDFQAQRQLFRSISDIVSGDKSNIQAIICTHSPRMIDQAPAQNIRMLKCDEGKMLIEKLNTSNDTDVETFLSNLARELGITNTLMFYENCYILVEGETEENALPHFYRTIYKHGLIEDGINIINVKGKGAFKEFLKLLSHNKQELSLFFMDSDCADDKEDALTKQVIKECGFSDKFCESRIILVGNKEFEDVFPNIILAKTFNKKWPKTTGDWEESDFSSINPEKKYSDELKRLIWDNCNHDGDKWSKPELGNELGKLCKEDEIPNIVKELFSIARSIAEVD